jgi:hypothetical protein
MRSFCVIQTGLDFKIKTGLWVVGYKTGGIDCAAGALADYAGFAR